MTDTTAARARRVGPPRRRQQEILEAAAEVFHRKGYESTSIQDIADAVGILKGSLYYYIDSKEDLLYAILQGVHEDALRNIERTKAIEGDPLQKIRAFVTLHIAFNAENLVKMGVFFQDFRSLGEERRAVIVEERDQYDQFLRTLIQEGQEQGVVCADVDPKLAGLAILGMTNWIYHWYQPTGERTAEELAQAYADLVVAGLACDPAAHTPGHRSKVAPLDPGVIAAALANGAAASP
jgi:TetR/AcrR family transcriptional regulator, cholesterol catabolism regulator